MTHLRIELNELAYNLSARELVSGAFIEKLYNIITDLNNVLDGTSHLKGYLNADATYLEYIDVLTDNTKNLTKDMNITSTKIYLMFEDSEVKRRVIAWFFNNKQDTNGVSIDELTIPTNFLVGRRGVISGEGYNRTFEGITNVYKFNELSRFTNVTELPPNWAGSASFTEIDLSNILTFGNACFSSNNISYADLSSVTNIGTETFEDCSNLTTVVLNPNLTTIGYRVFYNCNKLENIDLSNIVTIGYGAFYKTKLTSVNLSNCTTINGAADKGAFMLCSNLASVTLNSNLTTLGRECFNTCTALTSIDLSNITSLGYKAFNDCSSLTSIDLSNVTSIGDSAFSGCTSLSSIGQLNSNLTSIPVGCFKNCTSLTSIDLSNITLIGPLAPNNDNYNVGAFLGCTSLTTVTGLSDIDYIGGWSFTNCTSLGTNQDLVINTTQSFIGAASFYNTKYKSVVVNGPNVNTLSNGYYHPFLNMPNCTYFDISNTAVTRLGSVINKTNLETMILPSTYSYIYYDLWWFNNNNTFKYFIILATTPPTYDNVTYCRLGTNGNFYVPDSAVSTYKSTWPATGNNGWDIHGHIKPLSELPVGIWKTGLYLSYEPYLSNSSDPAYSTV